MKTDIIKWAALYKKTLKEDVIPFWIKYSIDKKTGAIYNCLDDSGNVLSEDKYLWSQGRALWMFSALYNRFEQNSEWLDIAKNIYTYLLEHGRDDQGYWMYRLDPEGNIKEKDVSIYVDGFVINGLGEYYRASGDMGAARLAYDTFKNIHKRLAERKYNIAPYTIPEGMKTHGICMIFSFFFYNLGQILQNGSMSCIGYDLALEIPRDFYMPQKDAILEFVAINGHKTFDTPEKRTCVPGHVLESMWFLISIFERTGDKEQIKRCCRLIKRHIELGWDAEYGGIFLALDINGMEPVYWKNSTYKPWWVQVEALVATMYAYLHTGEDWCLAWHKKIQDYAYTHYPVEGGEWTQWLDRFGNRTASAALPVKDPFHLPRGLLYLIELCEKIFVK